ncbi:MAG: hypothetical protein M1840_000761 [Geoglossum simile]|nr:MAG: hypothetical protein M1840_000761 [Geoglossum simile]
MSGLNVDYMAYPPIADLEAKIKAGLRLNDQDSSQDSWLRQFRISEFSSEAKVLDLPLTSLVYAKSGTVFVSGVGLRGNPRSVSWFVPLGEDEQDHYPWEDRLTEQTVYSEVRRNAQANPYDVLDISQLLAMPPDHPPSPTPPSQSKDCFMLLPWEILEDIAKLLPTTDALILRLASRSFGYKLVTLAVAETTRPPNQMSEPQELSLRRASLWYPTVPDTDLCLNEASFTGELPSASGYRPLSWILFGGARGAYLRNLTQITVSSLGNLDSIEFRYDTDGIVRRKKLGRHRVTESSKLMRFPIDGQGGEIIMTGN